jgi:hypothetical protein
MRAWDVEEPEPLRIDDKNLYNILFAVRFPDPEIVEAHERVCADSMTVAVVESEPEPIMVEAHSNVVGGVLVENHSAIRIRVSIIAV